MNNTVFSQKVQIELVKLLYQQIPIALWGESLAAICLVIGLWGSISSGLLIGWLIFTLVCGLVRHGLVYAYHRSTYKRDLFRDGYDYKLWLGLFAAGAFLSGVSWGAVGSLLLVENDQTRHIFEIFMLAGVTAAASPLYAPSRIVYPLFLLTALVPFSINLILQGGVLIMLGLLSFVYMFILFGTSYYAHRIIYASLALRFENTDLVDNLSNAKNTLENKTQELEKSLSLVKATLESATDGILAVDIENKVEDYNKKFTDMWNLQNIFFKGQSAGEVINRIHHKLSDPQIFLQRVEEVLKNVDLESFDELFFKDGRIFEVYSYPQHVGSKCVGRVWNFRDVTERKSLEDKLFHQANYDALTGLPNRTMLLEHAANEIDITANSGALLAVLYLDIDGFKYINDSMGHVVGDEVLVTVAERLTACAGKHAIVTREGGDEFIIVLTNLQHEADATLIAHQCLESVRKPMLISGNKFSITISIGINFFPRDAQKAELLIRNADIAMYRAKELGKNNLQYFTEEMNRKILNRLVIENNLIDALEKNEFYLVYQPLVSLKTGKIVGVEALIRWSQPQLGLILPSNFIPVAEESGVIVPIGAWVLRRACMQAKQWQVMGIPPIRMGVNLSGRQFKQPNLLESIHLILHETQLDPSYLSIELTESTIMHDMEKNIDILNKLKQMGISIAIDDFGVGYSSLNYLKQLPVDKLKIDRSFIKDIPQQADDVAITSAIIALGDTLGIKVLAEGVENQDQLNFLMEHHCDEMQGYYFSKPLEAAECTKLLMDMTNNLFKLSS